MYCVLVNSNGSKAHIYTNSKKGEPVEPPNYNLSNKSLGLQLTTLLNTLRGSKGCKEYREISNVKRAAPPTKTYKTAQAYRRPYRTSKSLLKSLFHNRKHTHANPEILSAEANGIMVGIIVSFAELLDEKFKTNYLLES